MTNVDLKPFCGDERWPEPWVVGGMRIATDGRILVALPTDEPDSPRTFWRGQVNLNDLLKDVPCGPMPPRIVAPRDVASGRALCPACQGKPPVGACRECKGAGDVECPTCEQDYPCPDCDGTGNAPRCDECEDAGFVPGDAIGDAIGDGVYMDGRYYDLIAALPGVEFQATLESGKAMQFRFDGGRGVVMPIVPTGSGA